MNQNEIITAVVALMVCGLLAGVTAIPLIAGISQETISEEYNDESNAGWLRMAYDNKPFDVEITADGDNITAGGQTGLNDDMILYADASACVMCVNGAFVIVNGYAATPEVINATSVAITNADGSLTVEADGDTVITATSPAWAYYPDTTGKYAYFGADVDGVKIKSSINQAYAGTFAGVYAYNNTVVAPNGAGDLGLSLNAVVEDDIITSVTWGESVADTLSTTATDFDPSTITLQPLDPSIIDDSINGGSVGLMAVPTPQYQSGDWGFNKFGSVYNLLVSYSGPAGDIVAPYTLTYDGIDYNMQRFGKGDSDAQVFDNASIQGSTLRFENGFEIILAYALSGCSGFTGTLVLPDTVRTIERNSFSGCSGFTGTLVLPNNVTSVGSNAFTGCSGLDSLIVTSNPTFTENERYSTFYNSGIKEVLNLGSTEITTTSYGLNADEVREDVPASGYIAPLSTTAVVTKEGAVYDLISLLPLIMVLGIVMMGVYAVGTRYA